MIGGDADYTLPAGTALELTCYVVVQNDGDMVSDAQVEVAWITIDAGMWYAILRS